MARPKSDHEKLTLRLPPQLHGQVKVLAAENGRSLNAEIIQRLRASLESYRKY